jgi:Tryptophan-associated transmembrane protein (Trp_oprn_chp)
VTTPGTPPHETLEGERGPGSQRRRQRTYAILGGAVAAGLALLAASRTWLVETVVRAEPLPPVVTPRTGAALSPALPALALVALAGAGGLLATRGRGRQVVAALVLLAGLGLAVLAATKLGVAAGWALLTAAAGVGVAAAGLVALVRGAAWPSLGARYERAAERADSSVQAGTPVEPNGEIVSQSLWDAIERGEDPTKR